MMNRHSLDPLQLDFTPKPGIIYFLTAPDGTIPAEWETHVMKLAKYGFEVETRPTSRPDLRHHTVARLFNIGNITTRAYVWIAGTYGPHTSGMSVSSLIMRLTNLEDERQGSADVTIRYEEPPLYASMPCMSLNKYFDDCCALEEDMSKPRRDEENDFIEQLDTERHEILNRIGLLISEYVRRYHEMPPLELLEQPAQGKFIITKDNGQQFSPVVVNGNLDIVLPDYNEMILRLTPLPKIVYILFLMHPEGIRLKEIADYRHTLEELYLLVKPGSDERLARASIDDLCTPGSESLNQKISMIKRAVTLQLTLPTLTAHYTISGRRGEPYTLQAANNAILPSIVSAAGGRL